MHSATTSEQGVQPRHTTNDNVSHNLFRCSIRSRPPNKQHPQKHGVGHTRAEQDNPPRRRRGIIGVGEPPSARLWPQLGPNEQQGFPPDLGPPFVCLNHRPMCFCRSQRRKAHRTALDRAQQNSMTTLKATFTLGPLANFIMRRCGMAPDPFEHHRDRPPCLQCDLVPGMYIQSNEGVAARQGNRTETWPTRQCVDAEVAKRNTGLYAPAPDAAFQKVVKMNPLRNPGARRNCKDTSCFVEFSGARSRTARLFFPKIPTASAGTQNRAAQTAASATRTGGDDRSAAIREVQTKRATTAQSR